MPRVAVLDKTGLHKETEMTITEVCIAVGLCLWIAAIILYVYTG